MELNTFLLFLIAGLVLVFGLEIIYLLLRINNKLETIETNNDNICRHLKIPGG